MHQAQDSKIECDSATRRDYARDGYFVAPGLIQPALCDEIIAAAMRLPSAGSKDFRPAMQPHCDDPAFIRIMRWPQILTFVRAFVGGEPRGLQTVFYYCRPGTVGFARHQDNFFVEAPSDAFASAWVALVDVGPQNGGLTLYPGSHREGRLPVRPIAEVPAVGQDPNARNEESIVPEGYAAVDLELKKGSVVFLHADVVHCSNVNHSDRFRYSLLNTYIRAGSPFRPGGTAGRAEIDLT